MKALMIYYNGQEYGAKRIETEHPDSSVGHVHGLPDGWDVIAVVTGFKETEDFTVYIDEQEHDLG